MPQPAEYPIQDVLRRAAIRLAQLAQQLDERGDVSDAQQLDGAVGALSDEEITPQPAVQPIVPLGDVQNFNPANKNFYGQGEDAQTTPGATTPAGGGGALTDFVDSVMSTLFKGGLSPENVQTPEGQAAIKAEMARALQRNMSRRNTPEQSSSAPQAGNDDPENYSPNLAGR